MNIFLNFMLNITIMKLGTANMSKKMKGVAGVNVVNVYTTV